MRGDEPLCEMMSIRHGEKHPYGKHERLSHGHVSGKSGRSEMTRKMTRKSFRS